MIDAANIVPQKGYLGIFELMLRGKRAPVVAFFTLMIAASAYAGSRGVSPHAYQVGRFLGLPVTNSMIMSWIVSIGLVIAIRLAVGKRTLIPSRSQAVVESIAMGIRNLVEPILGKKMVGPAFPLLVGFFTFILGQNIFGLLPGVGTIGHEVDGHFVYYLRPGTADLNMTLALAIIAMVAWLYYVLRYVGIGALVHELFGNKASKNDLPVVIYYLLYVVFFGVGLIEVISICLRPVSLSLRLYGNIFSGENLLTSMTGIFAWLVPVPFYFLEGLVAIVQALVFTLLVAVYIGLVCNHEEGSH